jgi:hypothetical protein
MHIFARVILTFGASLLAADEKDTSQRASGELEKQRSNQAQKLCRQGAQEYRLFIDGAPRTELELNPDPVLRWSNPSVGSIHGLVFLWTDRGRPAAVASIYKWFEPLDHMAFEVHSLAETPLMGKLGERPVWNSSRPGVEFNLVEDAPEPAKTAAARLTQMRAISKDFTVEKTDREQARQQMRLLTQPVFRYQSTPDHVADGAIFAFVQGTDPEVLLLIESREADGRAAWHYALARMDSVLFRASYQGREVWKAEELPWATVFDNRSPYNILNLDHLSPPKQ